jgi:hypothetical protein
MPRGFRNLKLFLFDFFEGNYNFRVKDSIKEISFFKVVHYGSVNKPSKSNLSYLAF